MPEGPEIHRAADRVDAALRGRVADQVFLALDELRRYSEVLSGREVQSVEARGKAMLTRFEGGWNVYSHNQLYGRWMIRDRGNVPKTGRQLRFAVHNQHKSAFLYSASDMVVLPDAQIDAHPYLSGLGPDPLRDPEEQVYARFDDPAFARRQLAGLLLNQGFVGGIGNYLRTEILWMAEVHPREKLGKVDDGRRGELARATVVLMKRSYDLGGITNDPCVVQSMKQDGWRRRDYRHFAFGRDGQPCYRCGRRLVREQHAGRRVYRCPQCQPSP